MAYTPPRARISDCEQELWHTHHMPSRKVGKVACLGRCHSRTMSPDARLSYFLTFRFLGHFRIQAPCDPLG
jgi:hypothetical protein